jgi:hypothetical protein
LTTNYWIFKVKDELGGLFARSGLEIFAHRTQDDFWGINRLTEKGKANTNVDLLRKGDHVIFYLVGKHGSRFLGTCLLDSGFEQLNEEDAKKVFHREYLDLKEGVFLKKVDKWTKALSLEYLKEKGLGSFGKYFQGNIKKIKRKEDFDAIIREHKLMT